MPSNQYSKNYESIFRKQPKKVHRKKKAGTEVKSKPVKLQSAAAKPGHSEPVKFANVAALQQEKENRQQQFKAATRKFKVQSSDKNTLVYLTASPIPLRKGQKAPAGVIVEKIRKTVRGKRKVVRQIPAGQRVSRGSRRKVYILLVDGKGKVKPYYDWNEQDLKKVLPPKPVRIQSAKIRSFKNKKVSREFYAGREQAQKGLTIQRKRGQRTLDFMDDVVPQVARVLKQAADAHLSRRQFDLHCVAQLQLPDGELFVTPVFHVDFLQSDAQQLKDTEFYEPFISKQLYAEFAETLKDKGMVTTGSSQFIYNLPINSHLDLEDDEDRYLLRDARGDRWKDGEGWNFTEAKLIKFEAIPHYVVTRSRE